MSSRTSAVSKIKVYHVITRMIVGGAQENTLYTVEGLHNDSRFEVVLLTGPSPGPEGELLEKKSGTPLDIRVIRHMQRAINPIRDIMAIWNLWKIFKRERPHIVHTHSSKAGILGRVAAWFAGVPVIIHTIHGLPFHPYQSSFLNSLYCFLERIGTRISDKIIVVAHAMRDSCLRCGIGTPSKYIRIFSGMNVDDFINSEKHRDSMRKKLGLAPDDFVLIKIARFFPLKGHDDLIEIVQSLKSDIPRMKCILLGDGILQEDLKKTIEKYGLSEYFIFAGLVSPDEVAHYISAADIVIHTSYREGLARIIPQGLLAGKPVLTYRIDGAPEVIDDYKNGRLITAGDIEGMAKAVLDVYVSYSEYQERVEIQRKTLSQNFSVPKMISDIIFCYLTFIDNRL